MSTPADAPYKLAQVVSRPVARRIDRRRLRAVALVLAVEGGDPVRLNSLLAMMTRAERREHDAAVAREARAAERTI